MASVSSGMPRDVVAAAKEVATSIRRSEVQQRDEHKKAIVKQLKRDNPDAIKAFDEALKGFESKLSGFYTRHDRPLYSAGPDRVESVIIFLSSAADYLEAVADSSMRTEGGCFGSTSYLPMEVIEAKREFDKMFLALTGLVKHTHPFDRGIEMDKKAIEMAHRHANLSIKICALDTGHKGLNELLKQLRWKMDAKLNMIDFSMAEPEYLCRMPG